MIGHIYVYICVALDKNTTVSTPGTIPGPPFPLQAQSLVYKEHYNSWAWISTPDTIPGTRVSTPDMIPCTYVSTPDMIFKLCDLSVGLKAGLKAGLNRF